MKREEFASLAAKGRVILDGATGTNLMRMGMPKGVCTEAWVLDHPDTILSLQRAYADAGSQIVIAPTFGANRHMLDQYGLGDQAIRMNRELAALTRKAVEGRAFVAGDIAPTGLILESAGGEASIEDVFEVVKEQAAALADAGVDLIMIETEMSGDEASIALDAALSATDLPVTCTMSVQADGQAYYGGSIFDAAETLEAMGASAVGVNCGNGPDQLESLIRKLRGMVSIPIIAKPNAGLPTIGADGQAHYDMGPDAFAAHMKSLAAAGAGVLGGCCGTTPEYIARMVRRLEEAD